MLEIFLWKDASDVKILIESDREFKKTIEEELADVLCFCLSLANVADIDVVRAVEEKIEVNRLKYPVAKARGLNTKYDKL